MAKPVVGVQLIIFGKRTKDDLAGVLDEVAAAGFAAVETGYMAAQIKGKDFRKMLSDRGLKHVGAHWTGQKLEEVPAILDWLKETGATDLPMSDLDTTKLEADLYKRKAAEYNAAGELCRKAGVTLSYHNHSWEFGKVDGKIGLELLYELTDPNLLKACIDAYWVWDGGSAPAAFVKKYASRLRILHAKDSFSSERGKRTFCPVGAGVLDFPAIVEAAGKVKWVVVEQDVPREGLTDAAESALSRKNLKEKMGL